MDFEFLYYFDFYQFIRIIAESVSIDKKHKISVRR